MIHDIEKWVLQDSSYKDYYFCSQKDLKSIPKDGRVINRGKIHFTELKHATLYPNESSALSAVDSISHQYNDISVKHLYMCVSVR